MPYGTLGLFFWAFMESSFFPIPPDVLLIALSLKAPSLSLWFAFVCTIGSVIGAIFGFYIGKYGGRPLLNKMFKQEKILLVQNYYQKYDVWAVGIAGFTPIPYKVFTITAGAFYLDFKRFLIASIISRSGRFFIVGGFIYIFGDVVKPFVDKYFNYITILFVLLLVGGFYFIKLKSSSATHNKECTVQ